MKTLAWLLTGLVIASYLGIAGGTSAVVTAATVPTRSGNPAPASMAPFFPNTKITDGLSPLDWQVEPTMVVNQSGTIFVGWKETTGPETAGVRVGASYSTDQGLSWAPNILMNQFHPPSSNCHNSDPWMALDPTDRVHFGYLEYDCGSGFDVSNTTNGNDWGTVHYLPGHGGLVDKDSIAFDTAGRLYATWDENNDLALTWSDDGGNNWVPIRNPGNVAHAVLGAIVGTFASNTVHLTWWDINTDDIMFESSTDRGQTWSAQVRVNDVPGSAVSIGPWRIPIPTMNVDPNSGAISIAWPDNRNGNQDIFFAHSTDGGATWGTNHRINDDTGTTAQWMVDLAIDSVGIVHAAWEDGRNGAWNIFYSNSTDGGQTWTPNLRVSSEDTSGSFNRPGDYFSIETGPNDYIYVVWTDGRGQDFDIYYARNPGFLAATVTVATDPAGLPVTIDGVTSTAPVQKTWTIGSAHDIGVASVLPISGTARYNWIAWSDGGAASHQIVANIDQTITASFMKQYLNKVTATPTGRTFLVDGLAYNAQVSFWWDDGSAHALDAPSPQSVSGDLRYVWSDWSDHGQAAHTITANAALLLTATFIEEDALRVLTSPGGLTFSVDGTSYSAATTFWFEPHSFHTISVATLQSSGSGTRYLFASWSDGGAATHVVPFARAASFTATFSIEYYLTVTSLVPGSSGSGWYPAGSAQTAHASNDIYAVGPGERIAFVGWGGDASGNALESNPIVMDGPKTAVAQYGTQFYLDVSSAYGTATGGGWYSQGSVAYASLSSTEVPTSTGVRQLFVRWSGDASGEASTSAGIVMDRTKVASAVWQTQYLLTIQTAFSAPTTAGWYDSGASAVARLTSGVVSVAGGTRAVFVAWIGDTSGMNPAGSDSIAMDGPQTVGATWRIEYELRIDTAHGQEIGAGWYPAGSFGVAAVNASIIEIGSGERVVFVGWTGDAVGDSASGSSPMLMSQPRNAQVQWSTEYFLRVISDIGTISGSGWYSEGASVELRAPAESASQGQTVRFAGWTGDTTSADRTVTVTMDGPMTVRATWATTAALGGLSGTAIGLVLIVVAIALIIGLLVWWRSHRRRE